MAQTVSILTAMLAVASFFPTTSAQNPPNKPTIAVISFANPSNYYDSTIGNGLTDLFISELMKRNLYRIVERDALPELIDEIDLGQSEYASPFEWVIHRQEFLLVTTRASRTVCSASFFLPVLLLALAAIEVYLRGVSLSWSHCFKECRIIQIIEITASGTMNRVCIVFGFEMSGTGR